MTALERLPLLRRESRTASQEDLALAHDPMHVEAVLNMMPDAGFNFIDNDTLISPKSGDAAMAAAGAVIDAVGAVMSDEADNVFCAVRPPGHHAHFAKSGGFCLFNNIALGACAALARHGLSRVAIVDIDVHHGDGTQNIFWDDARVFFASMHQSPLYPFTGAADEQGRHGNILNIPLAADSGGAVARKAVTEKIIPRLEVFRPEMIFVSAGFDAHESDPIGGLGWTTPDYAFMMAALLDAARDLCGGRLIAVLEGGYDVQALANSVTACVEAMIEKGNLK
jgi:acetoin utilization deacetylase AcuC-like enzyme